MNARDIINEWTAILGQDRRFDVERLAAHCTKRSRASLLAHMNDAIPADAVETLQHALRLLQSGTPLQYLLGETWFMGHCFYVDERVLIPRFDTEMLVLAALEASDARGSLLDVCTGSGAIAIAYKLEKPLWEVCGGDVSADALAVAALNAERLQAEVTWRCGDLFTPWQDHAPFSCIVSNPPYISPDEYETLAPEVKKEPSLALLGGPDGLDYYRRITTESRTLLQPGGRLLVEIGATQGKAVESLFREKGFEHIHVRCDAQGLDRVVEGQLPSPFHT